MALSFEYKFLKWGYSSTNGPATWPSQYPHAKEGKRQSPIDISVGETDHDPQLPAIRAEYRPCPLLNLENTGVSWQLHFYDPDISSLTGGPLGNEYKIVQMHAHWGRASGHGSEHTVDGAAYDAELHMVHYNTKYPSAGEAFDKSDGLAVLGMLVKVGREHQEFRKLCDNFSQLEKPLDTFQIEAEIDPSKFLPDDRSYFTYSGSLTTPPLYESVTWMVFRSPIEMSQEQLDSMRSIQTGSGKKKTCLVDNFRPPCCLKERTVRYCCAQ